MTNNNSPITNDKFFGGASPFLTGGAVSDARMKQEAPGFTLIEALIALLILAFGLLTAGQLIFVAMKSTSLARSKESAALVAQNKLETLADLYRRNPNSLELSEGDHDGEFAQVAGDGLVLNRFGISWKVSTVPDPRGGAVPHARLIQVTVTPVGADGTVNAKTSLNKTVIVASVFSSETR